MGKAISSLFTTQLSMSRYRNRSGIPIYRVCQTCQGEKYMSVFRMPECMKNLPTPTTTI